MYLIIRDDETCAERTPPWGEPTIERYVARLRRGLEKVEASPALRLGFEWSGLELEMLATDFPDVLDKMKKLAAAGKVTFYHGTYSQPHLQILSSESNVQQFEIGREVYQTLGLPAVETYAHQEASLHDQVPQLLRAVGIRYATIPAFVSTLRWLGETELLSTDQLDGLRFVHGHEFVSWQGLDGTGIPLYLSQPVHRAGDRRVKEAQLDLLHRPPIRISMPDMMEISDRWLADHAHEEIVLLQDALDERARAVPITGRVRFYTNWSYIEGIRAEELSRANRDAEAQLLGAEAAQAIASVLANGPVDDVATEWRELLRWQHHDGYCFCSPGLKDQAIPRLRELSGLAARRTESALRVIGEAVDSREQEGQPILFVNTTPHSVRVPAQLTSDIGGRLVNPDGSEIPAGPALGSGTGIEAVIDMDGLGYRLLYLQAGDATLEEEAVDTPVHFENRHYSIQIAPDATISSLRLAGDDTELIDAARGGGNHLTATDSDGISPAGSKQASLDRDLWKIPAPGRPLRWQPTAPTAVRQTPLGLAVTATGRLNDRATGQVVVRCYQSLPWIAIDWTFHFDNASIGTFFDDESKLLTRWAYAIDGHLAHDIPFGAISTEPNRPILPTTWVDYSDTSRGITQFHFGTPKYWLTDHRLSNLVAWGEHTDAIGNRMEHRRWLKSFDQRLRGQHRIRYAIYPHTGSWKQANLPLIGQSIRSPLSTVAINRHHGTLPPQLTLLRLDEPSLVATAVRATAGGLQCRLFETHGQDVALSTTTNRITLAEITSLPGETLTGLGPFQIANTRYRTDRSERK
jgi:hypothetical protein